jgi:Trp operon repressor
MRINVTQVQIRREHHPPMAGTLPTQRFRPVGCQTTKFDEAKTSMTNKNAKPIAKLLEAVREVIERDLGLKLYSPEDLRLTIESRQKVAKTLIAGGASERDVAHTLGVDRTTIRRDLGRLSGSKRPEHDAKSSNKSTDDGAKGPDSTTASEQYHADSLTGFATRFEFRVDAGKAVQLAKKAIEEITPVIDTLSEVEIAVLTERALEAANYWTRAADVVRKRTPNQRGHLEVVSEAKS